jgi:uncharacterized membrane protein YjdF
MIAQNHYQSMYQILQILSHRYLRYLLHHIAYTLLSIMVRIDYVSSNQLVDNLPLEQLKPILHFGSYA